jgi:two-component system, cell cycle sensor histidine kinase and response regulator CckA
VTSRISKNLAEISILILEDNPADAKLMLHQLHKAGFNVRSNIARSPEEFKTLAGARHYTLVLADYYVPSWTGLDALRWLRRLGYTMPVILVTGSLGDEQAVECLKEGASDYVLKERIERLPVAVNQALKEQQLREERDQAEREMRASERQYRLLFNSNPQPMWVYDMESLRILAVNDAAIEHYGYTREEFLSFTLKDIRPPEEVPKLLASVEEYRQKGPSRDAGVWKHRKKDGKIIYVKITEGQLDFIDYRAGLVCVEDVTERQILEQQFLQAQKMEAVGRLAGGVAHDFNNLLMVMSSSAHLLQDRKDNPEVVNKYADQIRHAADKAAALTRQLLAFSRQQVLQPTILDINSIISDLLKMLPRLLGEDIDIVLGLDPKLGRVSADRGQIEQVIVNLAVNARDAMPSGGKLSIETANVELDGEYTDRHQVRAKPGSYVMLAMSDTGTGMSHEIQARIFEPFFTTKELGKGTGLGLATVYGIIKQSDGLIWVYSEPGRGSSFKIYIPRAGGNVHSDRVDRDQAPVYGTETILLVEDEQALRQVTVDYLESKGYRLLQAQNGPEAVKLSQSFDGVIDFLVTDMVMPGFGGPLLAQAILSHRPHIRVIFVSGYTDRTVTEEILSNGAVFIQKPFSLDVLALKIRSMISK